MTTTKTQHVIRWHGYSWDPADPYNTREEVPRNRHMRGRDWGWDARCSCGWESRTGGAIEARIHDAIQAHKWDAAHGFA